MLKRTSLLGPIILIILLWPIPCANAQWDYSNYLYSLDILSYTDPATAGDTGSVTVKVGANTDVDVHFELKGRFSWGEWTLSSDVISVGPGTRTVTCEVGVPYKTLIDPASGFYYYVYVTLQGDSWNSQVWGMVRTVTVSPPSEVTSEELLALMSQLKWEVDSSSLSRGIKKSLFLKLEAAGKMIASAYDSSSLRILNGAMGSLKAFVGELNSNNEASSYPDSNVWAEQANIIIERIKSAT